MQKRIVFFKGEDFFFPPVKILLTFKGRAKPCRFIYKCLIFAWNSPNLHVGIVGVCYWKGSYWRIKQLPQKIAVIWHTQTFREKVKLWGGKGEFRTACGREDADSFYAQRDPLTISFISFLLPCSQPICSAQDMWTWLQINDWGEGGVNKWAPLKMVGG